MRTITTDWNNASYASATSFTDIKGGVLAIPANTPSDVRALQHSVIAGDYIEGALTNFTRSPTTSTKAAAETQVCTVTVTNASAVAMPGILLTAVSGTPARATVSPAEAKTDANGQVAFTITAVASGACTVTFATKNGQFSTTHVMTVS
jgi:hypothetical protein